MRTCYKTKARFFDDSPRQSDIIWYRPRTGATVFFGHNRFAHPEDRRRPVVDDSIGEVKGAAVTYSTGHQTHRPLGTAIDGLPYDFEHGVPFGPYMHHRLPDGIPADCAQPELTTLPLVFRKAARLGVGARQARVVPLVFRKAARLGVGARQALTIPLVVHKDARLFLSMLGPPLPFIFRKGGRLTMTSELELTMLCHKSASLFVKPEIVLSFDTLFKGVKIVHYDVNF
jgi:hypothetical protein